MNRNRRQQIRAAVRIHERLVAGRQRPNLPQVPHDLWRQFVQATAHVSLAEKRGWAAAASAARNHYRRLAGSLGEHLVASTRALDQDARSLLQIQTASEILSDLVALEAEFDEVELDLQKNTLGITTDPVVLESIDLGRFRILLHWDDLPDPGAYEVQALDPCPAASDRTTTHPHVRDNGLCEGEGRVPIRSALAAGRLFDFALLVRGVLSTYNAGSAYVPLSRWHGCSCADCGYLASDEESTCCELCSADLCCDCTTSCGTCGRGCCSDCRDNCQQCDESHCESCLRSCAGCEQTCCRACLTDDLCERCRAADESNNPPPDQENQHESSEKPVAA
jgi:hypothetical protein